jgi:hypothetical protein
MPNHEPESLLEDRPLDWALFAEKFTMALGPANGDMNTMLLEPHVGLLAQLLQTKLEEAAPSAAAVKTG